MQLNDSLFRENGGCGYVLKPPHMIDPSIPPASPIKVYVHVISAQQLPKLEHSSSVMHESVNPFVVVSLHGIRKDKKEKRTKTVKNNGFNPIWDEVSSSIEKE